MLHEQSRQIQDPSNFEQSVRTKRNLAGVWHVQGLVHRSPVLCHAR